MKKEFQQINKFNKQKENFKTKNTIIKIDNTKDWLRIQGTEERITKLEDRVKEITNLKKNAEIQESWVH